MRIHFASNEKIISRCIDNFETVFPGDNKWIIFKGTGRDYVGTKANVIKCDYDTKQFWDSVGELSQYEKIIIHFLSQEMIDFVCKIEHDAIYWIEWGTDLYNGLLKLKGYQLYTDNDIQRVFSNHRLPKFIYWPLEKIMLKKTCNKTIKAVKKIHYFVPDSMYNEYPLLLKYYPELNHLEYRDFFYYPIDEILGDNFDNLYSEGDNIIVGHSANLTGNQIEVYELLSNLDLNGRKVYSPLSYGNMKYADYVKRKGTELLGQCFTPITDFLPLQGYNSLMRSANVFIYNHYRQEAVGNILIALYIGGRVFLNKKNPLLSFYKSLGLKIFELEDLYHLSKSPSLSETDVATNRKILINTYSRERLLRLIKNNM